MELPAELVRALRGSPAVRARFEKPSFTRRREMARSVAEARKPETKARRVARILEELSGDR